MAPLPQDAAAPSSTSTVCETAAPSSQPDAPAPIEPKLDIEHLLVNDDPRLWSTTRKSLVLA